jgi:outer membrane protein OmpA-like peptidoglycan-associated protein
MKRVFLWMACGMLLIQSSVLAQQNEYSHWSLDLKLGLNRAEYVGGVLSKNGFGFAFGAELERTFNPLWGLAAGYNYLGYSYAGIDGSAHEFTGLATLNLANLVERYRKGNWQKLNVYGRLGGGFSVFSATNKGATIVIPMGASIEYNITQRLALSLNADRRWHLSSTMGFTKAVQDRPVYWAGTVGLRIKLGKASRPHVRNTSIIDYEAPYVAASNAPWQERLAYNEEDINQLQDQLNKINDDLNKANDELQKTNDELAKANEKIAACCAAPRPSADNLYVAAPVLKFENIGYEAEQYEVPPAFYDRLDNLAATLREHPGVKIEIVGHTDAVGVKEENVVLSLKRAEAVKGYLLEKGVDAARITTRGMAGAQPLAPNSTLEGRQKNRRVEVIFLTE